MYKSNRKYDDTPLYANNEEKQSVMEDLGYNNSPKRPQLPWANEVMRNRKKSARESPLKEWWLAEQAKQKEAANTDVEEDKAQIQSKSSNGRWKALCKSTRT